MCRLGNKDDINPDCPLGSDEFVSAGKFSCHKTRECYDVIRSGVDVISICGLLIQAGFSHVPYTLSKPWHPLAKVEVRGVEPLSRI